MRTTGLVLTALLWVGCASPRPADLGFVEQSDWAFAEPPPTEPEAVITEIRGRDSLTLIDALRLADVSNPDLAAERKEIDLATAAIWQAKLYPNPSFVFEFEEWNLSSGSTIGKNVAGISVPLVVSGRVGAATSLAEREREVAAIEYLGVRRTLLSDVKRGFIRVLAARDRVALEEKSRELAQSLRDTASARFAAQAVPEMEVLKASVSLARTDADLRTARRDLAVARNELLGLLGASDWGTVRILGDLRTEYPDVDLDELLGQSEETHSAVVAAKKRVEAAEQGFELEKTKRWQDWELELLAGRGSEADFIVEGGIRVPLPLADKNQAGIHAAQVRLEQARLELDSARNDLIPRVAQAYHAFTAARDRVGLFRTEILPQATKALEQVREGYRAGKFEYLDLLDAQRTLAEARVGYTTTVAEFNEAAATIEELSGTRLDPVETEE